MDQSYLGDSPNSRPHGHRRRSQASLHKTIDCRSIHASRILNSARDGLRSRRLCKWIPGYCQQLLAYPSLPSHRGVSRNKIIQAWNPLHCGQSRWSVPCAHHRQEGTTSLHDHSGSGLPSDSGKTRGANFTVVHSDEEYHLPSALRQAQAKDDNSNGKRHSNIARFLTPYDIANFLPWAIHQTL